MGLLSHQLRAICSLRESALGFHHLGLWFAQELESPRCRKLGQQTEGPVARERGLVLQPTQLSCRSRNRLDQPFEAKTTFHFGLLTQLNCWLIQSQRRMKSQGASDNFLALVGTAESQMIVLWVLHQLGSRYPVLVSQLCSFKLRLCTRSQGSSLHRAPQLERTCRLKLYSPAIGARPAEY